MFFTKNEAGRVISHTTETSGDLIPGVCCGHVPSSGSCNLLETGNGYFPWKPNQMLQASKLLSGATLLPFPFQKLDINKTGNVRANVILRHIRVTTVAMERQ